MKPDPAASRINCTVTASQKKKYINKKIKKIVTYRLIMFCIFLGRELGEKKVSRFLLQKLMVIYWEQCGSIYIVFY